MNIQEKNEVVAAEGESKAIVREAYSTPKITEFGTIQKITAGAGGSQAA